MTAVMYIGDAIEVMGKLPENSVDLVLTSPPFLALRSYLPADHPDKALEGGSQATPGEYVDWLLDVVEACARVLAPHGSLCFELGDTYSGSGGAGGDYNVGGWRSGQVGAPGSMKTERKHKVDGWGPFRDEFDGKKQPGGTGWPLAKSLSLIPESFRFAMVYGVNPHTGRRTAPWRLRNVIRWVRPNPPVGALGDKFRPATSELMVFCKSKDRFFDLDAVREPGVAHGRAGDSTGLGAKRQNAQASGISGPGSLGLRRGGELITEYTPHPSGAPPLDWWNIPLLDGEEPTRYGPKAAPPTHVDLGDKRKATMEGGEMGPYTPDMAAAGAPPLDWWNIPLLDGDEETRYGPKERNGNRPANGAPKERQVSNEQRQVRSERREPGDTEGIIWTNAAMANRTYHKDGGAPPLDWWNIPPTGYAGAHYAVWPPELLIKPIKAMCPEKVCRVCGEASRRIVRTDHDLSKQSLGQYLKSAREAKGLAVKELAGHFPSVSGGITGCVWNWENKANTPTPEQWTTLKDVLDLDDRFDEIIYNERSLIDYRDVSDAPSGWTQDGNGKVYQRLDSRKDRIAPDRFSDCGHDDWRPGVVLDPFAGSGTTLAVATGHGRDAIGIDLDERNYDLALERVGPLVLERGVLE